MDNIRIQHIHEDYGEVLHSKILEIFGDEMTYNELKPYTKRKNDKSQLEIYFVINPSMEFVFIEVFINARKIMEKKYGLHHSCDMFIILDGLEKKTVGDVCAGCERNNRFCRCVSLVLETKTVGDVCAGCGRNDDFCRCGSFIDDDEDSIR